MTRILSPHKEQDGYSYIRVMRYGHDDHGRQLYLVENEPYEDGETYIGGCGSFTYHDGAQDARTVSSRRVEEAVETADYLERCRAEGLRAIALPFDSGTGWAVWKADNKLPHRRYAPPTLREAYYRFHAKAEGESS